MRKFYEKAEFELKELLILDLTNSDGSSLDIMDDEEKSDDGSLDVG